MNLAVLAAAKSLKRSPRNKTQPTVESLPSSTIFRVAVRHPILPPQPIHRNAIEWVLPERSIPSRIPTSAPQINPSLTISPSRPP
jgi:hypothetical protein